MTTITTIMRKLRMKTPLCCCSSCLAVFPDRAQELQKGKAMLHRDQSLGPDKVKLRKGEVS